MCRDGNDGPIAQQSTQPPNIVLILVDSVGWGEFDVYGGGALRGVPPPNHIYTKMCGTNRLRLSVTGVSDSRMPMPHAP